MAAGMESAIREQHNTVSSRFFKGVSRIPDSRIADSILEESPGSTKHGGG